MGLRLIKFDLQENPDQVKLTFDGDDGLLTVLWMKGVDDVLPDQWSQSYLQQVANTIAVSHGYSYEGTDIIRPTNIDVRRAREKAYINEMGVESDPPIRVIGDCLDEIFNWIDLQISSNNAISTPGIDRLLAKRLEIKQRYPKSRSRRIRVNNG